MGGEVKGGAHPAPGRALAQLATAQQGVVTRSQLEAAGYGRRAIERRVAGGELIRAHRGVYLVGHAALAPMGREYAAVLACGPGAVISHRSAAAVWSFEPPLSKAEGVDVTVVATHRRSRDGLRIRRASRLDRADVRIVRGVPVTSPARTLIDRAAAIGQRELERAWAHAQIEHRLRPHDLESAIGRAGRRSGIGAVRTLLADRAGFTRSDAERTLRALVRAAALPLPAVNARLLGCEVDFHWRRERLAVEVDGYEYHADRRSFERDRDRDQRLAAAGYQVMRVTWRQLNEEPFAVIARIASALHGSAQASPTSGPRRPDPPRGPG